MFTYVIAIFIAIAALVRRVLRHMYGFSSFTEDEKKEIKETIEVKTKEQKFNRFFIFIIILITLLFFFWWVGILLWGMSGLF